MRVILLGIAVVALLIWALPGSIVPAELMGQAENHAYNLVHIILSIFTFVVLFVTGVQAILLAIQEWMLRRRPQGDFFQKWPPLEAMEALLFQMMVIGFLLLTLLFATSIYYFHALLWHNEWLIQKTAMVLFAWVIFAVLLLGRFLRGWRGRKAIYGTLFGVLLLIVVYFGSNVMLQGWLG